MVYSDFMNDFLNVYAPIILCFVPFVTVFILFKILVEGISVAKEFIATLAGLLALLPITLFQFLLSRPIGSLPAKALLILLYSIIFYGLIEEFFKALLLLIMGSKGENLKCWLCYSILAGLILGCFETVIYILPQTKAIAPAWILQVVRERIWSALIVHSFCAALGGMTVYYAKNIRRNFAPLIYAVLIHGVYDFFVAWEAPLKYFSVAVILLAIMECRIFYTRIQEEQNSIKRPHKIQDPNKTVQMPSGAIIIPVNKTVDEKPSRKNAAEKEVQVIEPEVADEAGEDFAAIEQEARTELKAAKKAARPKESPAPRKTGKAEEKTSVAKKTASVNASSESTKKPAIKKEAAAKTAPNESQSAKKAVTKKAATEKAAAGKPTTKTASAKAKNSKESKNGKRN